MRRATICQNSGEKSYDTASAFVVGPILVRQQMLTQCHKCGGYKVLAECRFAIIVIIFNVFYVTHDDKSETKRLREYFANFLLFLLFYCAAITIQYVDAFVKTLTNML